VDGELSKAAQKILGKQGMQFSLAPRSHRPVLKGDKVSMTLEPLQAVRQRKMQADIVLLAIGRRPITEGLRPEQAGVKLDERKRIAVDGHFQTNVKGIYAIGE